MTPAERATVLVRAAEGGAFASIVGADGLLAMNASETAYEICRVMSDLLDEDVDRWAIPLTEGGVSTHEFLDTIFRVARGGR